MANPPQANNPPVNLLSLDGGGIRGVSELIVLHEIMVRVQARKDLSNLPKPCEYFHLIGGTSTGGLIAIMLGRLEMSTEEALAQYRTLAGHIFGKKNRKSKGHDGAFKATTLEEEIKKLLQNCHGDPEALMCHEDATRENEMGRAFVCAVPATNMRFPRIFRTYKLLGNSDLNCKIWQAARATTAAPTFFKRISVPGVGGIEETFIDAGIRCNNPAREVREEAKRLFGQSRTVGLLVSIGTGHPGTIGLSKPDVFQRLLPSQLIDTLKNIATDCESVADQLASRYGEREDSVYFRFNVTHGVGQISLEEWKKIPDIVTHTRAYLQDSRISAYVDSVVQRLCDPSLCDISVSLALLCGQIPQQTVGGEQLPLEFGSTSYEPYESATIFGRDDERSTLVMTLCKGHAHVMILGGGGMGKTTLALSALCDVKVVEKHPSRHFVSCEGIYSVEALLTELANALRIRKRENLYDEVLTLLRQSLNPVILCLDNFETIWEAEETVSPPPIEQFLSRISRIPMLSIILTLRGSQSPLNVPWSNNRCVLAIKPLDIDSSQLLFKNISGITTIDIHTEKLLEAVDGVPLTIKLLASIVQEGLETTETLWLAWKKECTRIVKHGNDRLSNLELSIQLSLDCPRMRQDRNAIDTLAILSLLPDGWSKGLLDEFQTHLPHDFSLRSLVVSLAYSNRTINPERIQLLSPIRHFCREKLPKQESLVAGLIGFYTEFLNANQNYTDGTLHKTVPQELLNLHSVLCDAIKAEQIDPSLIQACMDFTRWSLYNGNPVKDIIQLATDTKAEVSLEAQADCLLCLAEVFLYQGRHEEAEESLNRAVELHRQAHSVLGEANDLQTLGDVFLRRSKLDEARESVNRAVELHRQAQDILGEAYDLQELGDVLLRHSKLDEAEELLNRAVELHQQAQDDVHGEAYDLQKLGNVLLRHSKLDEAEESLNRAVELHQQAQDFLGEANDLQTLGDVFLRRSKLDEAEESLNHAVELHRQAQDVLGEAYDLSMLGDVFLHRSKLDEAKELLNRAVELHRQAQDVMGEAHDLSKLGDVFLQCSKLNEAEELLNQAVDLHQQAQDVLGEANDLRKLGDVFLRRSKLDEAEESLNRALELHRQAQDVLGEANDLHMLGSVFLQRDNLDEAKESLNQAVELHRLAHSVLGEAHDLQRLGAVFLRQDQLDKAEEFLNRALELHRQAQNVLGEADDLQKLGDVYLHHSKLDDAEELLKQAVKLHQQAQDVLGEADDFQKLGEVFLKRNKPDEAEEFLNQAMKLHRQAQYVLGEADDFQILGDVFLHRSKLDDAEETLKHAVNLHRQAHSVSGEAIDLQKLRDVSLRRSKLTIIAEANDNAGPYTT
ncbi:hypothetical protein K435DRAFT_764610 [Dendrothele bispora CBS 962.96]|uniref:PNPLA domain-containing protein n=1 Tax=Dendrothele bispora (strain CBS 962.96) TaxID=1314807 RepID=A0A4S8L8D8_DENBC|nr:hypothetical protein K435DRAFT_764610 [Dendrothele bispora CBS 962.96]